ncbi:unnamed protein product [Auanema sp. JU1783]|nr:unnamed protein product [Auanema sp. JU1783]
MAAELKTLSSDDVASHNTPQSCWIILDNKVYDVTKFLEEHPGGEEVITQLAGQDATDAFNDVGHSRDAKEMAEEYLIGQLEKDASPAAAAAVPEAAEKPAKACGSSFIDVVTSPTWSNFLIPTAIGLVVYVLYRGAMKLMA